MQEMFATAGVASRESRRRARPYVRHEQYVKDPAHRSAGAAQDGRTQILPAVFSDVSRRAETLCQLPAQRAACRPSRCAWRCRRVGPPQAWRTGGSPALKGRWPRSPGRSRYQPARPHRGLRGAGHPASRRCARRSTPWRRCAMRASRGRCLSTGRYSLRSAGRFFGGRRGPRYLRHGEFGGTRPPAARRVADGWAVGFGTGRTFVVHPATQPTALKVRQSGSVLALLAAGLSSRAGGAGGAGRGRGVSATPRRCSLCAAWRWGRWSSGCGRFFEQSAGCSALRSPCGPKLARHIVAGFRSWEGRGLVGQALVGGIYVGPHNVRGLSARNPAPAPG